MKLVDGGWLKWRYGSTPSGSIIWPTVRSVYSKAAKAIIFLDGENNFRAQYRHDYKSRRFEKRVRYPRLREAYQHVRQFTRIALISDPTLLTFRWPGYEADDLIGLAACILREHWPISVIGEDKDLLQLYPRIQLYKLKIQEQWQLGDKPVFRPLDLTSYVSKLPIAFAKFIHQPKDVLLGLTVLGDRSDSIRRLLPPRAYDLFPYIQSAQWPFREAVRLFGQLALDNLYLTVLPGPWVMDPVPEPWEVLEMVDRGTYWDEVVRSVNRILLIRMLEVIQQLGSR